jgi:glyoxylase-like metal-dependent hydrolase (beta-lactamase superfamily II)
MTVIRNGRIRFFAQSDVTCYILRGRKGDLLIDTGLPQTFRAMRRWMDGFDVRYVLLTHAHPDHDWNAAKLQKRGMKLILSEKDRDLRQNFRSQPVLPTAPKYRLRNFMQNVGGAIVKSPRYAPDFWLDDGNPDMLRGLGFDADIIPLPGHTYGSVGVMSNGVLYCGDAFTMLWRKPDITPHAVSPALMRESLETVLRLEPKWLACGHGLPVRLRDAAPVIRAYFGNH